MKTHLREFQDKLQHYRQQLRKDHLHQIKAHVRMALIHQHTLAEVHTLFLPDAGQLSTLELFQKCRDILMDPFKQDTGAVEVIPIDMHVVFWQQYIQNLKKKSNIGYKAIPQLIEFMEQFQKRHNWSTVSQHSQYVQVISQLVQTLILDLNDWQKESFAQWITDVKYIRLVYRLYSSAQAFPHPQNALNLYKLIKQGLASVQLRHQIQTAEVVMEIARYGNPQQIYLLHKRHPQIFSKLLVLLDNNASKIQAIHFWPPVFYLLQVHSFQLLEIVQQGVVRVCGNMINSDLESSIYGALSVLRQLVGSEDQDVVEAVGVNQQMDRSKMWLKNCIDKKVYFHEKLDIRRIFFQILRQVLFKWKQPLLQNVCKLCQLNPDTLLDMIQPIWQSSYRDQPTVFATLQCICWLLLHHQLPGLMILQRRGMLSFIEKCCESNSQQIQEISSCILEGQNKGEWNQFDIEL